MRSDLLATFFFRSEEQKAMHRLCGDQYLQDVDAALRSQLDPLLTSEYCQKLFTAIDVDGSGAIDAAEVCYICGRGRYGPCLAFFIPSNCLFWFSGAPDARLCVLWFDNGRAHGACGFVHESSFGLR